MREEPLLQAGRVLAERNARITTITPHAQKKPREEFTMVDLLTCEGNSGKAQPNLWITQGLERGAYGVDATEYFL